MKLLLILLLMVSAHAFSATSATCQLVNGIYENSPNALEDMQFETVVDIFTLTNARTLLFRLDGQELKFLRSSMSIGRQTEMVYLMKKNDKAVRAAKILIDRSPRNVARTREFYGNMILSEEIQNFRHILGAQAGILSYNFYCRF